MLKFFLCFQRFLFSSNPTSSICWVDVYYTYTLFWYSQRGDVNFGYEFLRHFSTVGICYILRGYSKSNIDIPLILIEHLKVSINNFIQQISESSRQSEVLLFRFLRFWLLR